MATLTITADEDFTDGVPALPVGVTEIIFANATSDPYQYADFGADQFGGAGISNTLTLTGGAYSVVRVGVGGGITSFSAAGWNFNNWSGLVLLEGNSGNDTLTGSSGDDILVGQGGADSLLGGDGWDEFYYLDSPGTETGDSVDGGAGIDGLLVQGGTGWDFRNTTISNVEYLRLSGTTTVAFSAAQFSAGGIRQIYGDANDQQTVKVIGSNVNFFVIEFARYAQTVAMTIEGVNNVANSLTGSSWDEDLVGGNLSDTINGGRGNDTLDGRGGVDTMVGSVGNDSYQVDNAGDVIVEAAGEGSDQLVASVSYTLKAGVDVEVLSGSGGAINLTGNEIANTIYGTGGNNRLDGGGGADELIGGDGNDTYVVDNAGDIINERWSGGIDTVIAPFTCSLTENGTIVFGAVENLTLSGTAAINGTGNSSANVITGNAGANILDGAAGADTLRGMGGNDVYYIDSAGDLVDESLAGSNGSDTVVSSIGFSLANTATAKGAIENLTLAGTAAINGTGNSLANIITGNAAANVLNGGAGADTLRGLAGNDVYYVDNTGDVVDESFAGSAGLDTVVSSISFSLANTVAVKGWAENLTLAGAAVNGIGNGLANVITGNTAANVLNGGAGADTLRGMGGNDIYYIDSYGDVVDESLAGSTGVDTIVSPFDFNLGNTSAVRGTVENLTLTGATAIVATGTAGANILTGNTAGNVLAGLAGNDRLAGGLGNDTMVGGTGNDAFVFNTAPNVSTNRDVIADFANVTGNNDTIYLENAIFTKLATGGALNAAYFKLGTAAADANDFVVYNQSTGALFYDADGSGSGRAIQIATLANNATLTASDFYVI